MKVEQGVVLTPEGCRRVPDELDQFPVEGQRRIGEPLGLESRVDEPLAFLDIPRTPLRSPKDRVARNDEKPSSNVVRRPPLAKDLPRPVERVTQRNSRRPTIANGSQDEIEQSIEVGPIERNKNVAISGPDRAASPSVRAKVAAAAIYQPFRRESECRSAHKK